jgi:hypothetical protein
MLNFKMKELGTIWYGHALKHRLLQNKKEHC